ncbi:MAG: ornithine cyclodeaminase [Ruminococcaceae bacterium]|nr:ornithine cyclodeaminase [Oscillospiraceae bacterium]
MKLITFDNIKDLNISPVACYDLVAQMIKDKNTAILPPKISMKPMDGVFCNVMPCILEHVGGVKVVTRYPERNPSLDSKLMLFDVDSGEFLAIMDANWITAMRTGAVAAHSILLLGKTDFSTIGILGLGNTARAALLVLASKLPYRKFKVKLRSYKGQEKIFAERFSEFSNIEFTYVDSNEALVKGSDVVISAATYLPEDLCSDECFDEGVLVVPIHTLGFTNCDLFFDKVYADDYGHVHHFKNFDKFRYFAEVSDVINGKAEGRKNDKERILAYNIGVSMHDINYAAYIYNMIKDNPALQNIDMHDPTDKFWI